ncbi:MAG: hypothetical protein ACUVT7_04835 [Thermoplasmata archaeon]
MALEITWTRKAMKLPPEVRKELSKRLEELRRFFPEMKTHMKIGITRSLDGLVFQSNEGFVKLMVDVHRSRKGGWRYPAYWTLAHELMHLAQFNSKGVPGGERACDMHALARLPPKFIDDSPSYLVVPDRIREKWNMRHAALAHELAVEALARRRAGLRRYASWWESEFENRTSGSRARL